ncbi:metallophosphoesterase family protein [Paraburkholderia pallida]|uniref:Metallophosphoesterase n=1 Tax=Paraburkholderia pallida TaxID=2547399 RepID=A0A4P7D2B5_9BURK|nr:metallophosphoesterase family protein [Paraburkholderia pallida]QBR02796.1 metallophosphoesterase [Paraburkholderia pallida]
MKIAALSDIHGNLPALDAVLRHIRSQGADLIVNLGDIVSGSISPAETADRLMALDLPTIRGNHERQLLANDLAGMRTSDRFARAALRADQLDWIAQLPATLRIADEVLLVHGTPESDLDYFLETVTEAGCRAATQAEVERRAGDGPERLILCGHTHVPRSAMLGDGRLVVNPGSVGLQAYEDDLPWPHRIETGSPHARYATVTRTKSGWDAEFHAVEYDWDATADLARANGRPDWVMALREGRC